MTDFIQLPVGVAGINCVVKSKEGEDVAFVRLDLTDSGMRSAHTHSKHELGHIWSMEMCGECVCLIISWKTVEIPLDTIGPNEGHLNNLGISFKCRFEHTGDLSDIAEAISAQRRAVQLTPKGHANLPACLTNLGNSFMHHFKRTGDLSDMAEAISAQYRAVQLTPEGHADFPAHLNNLGNSFLLRFEHTGDVADIAESISASHRAVQLTPQGHADLPGRLNNLGNSFMCRFMRTGDLSDIAEAISAQHRAVQLTPEGHASLPTWLNNLGISFRCRFERTGNLSDIAEAISAQHRAVQLTPEGHGDLPTCLNNLGNSFMCRFESISAQHRAVQLTPEGHASLPTWLNSLGNSFMCCFERTGNLSDIAEAISAQHRAVQLTPQGHADLPGLLSNLGTSFMLRFEHTGDLSEIAEAILLTPEGHADLPGCLNNLGSSFMHRFKSTHSEEDLAASISNYKSAATSTFGPPRQRLKAARIWADLLSQHHPHLIALIAGLEDSIQALEAASAACSLGQVGKALEWLEQGRCIVWSQLSNLRTPLDDLRLHNSQLAQSVTDLSKQLETAGSSQGQSHINLSMLEKISLEDEARAHLNLARKWDDLLQTVRSIPGFESFLQPLPYSSLLQHLPASGPVVVINVDKQRCDAIALLAGQAKPLHIPLPNFSLEKAIKYRNNLKANLKEKQLRMQEVQDTTVEGAPGRGARPYKQVVVSQVLHDLWKEVASPILNALGFSKMDRLSTNPPPRIWWCPTGPLSFLPIHAAGTHPECVLNYVVSSYIPTVTALTDRVKDCRQINKDALGLFLTSQPNAPGTSLIPGTTKEVQSIFKMAAQTRARAAMYMEHYSCIHLACHASQNAAEPLQSWFLFHNGSLNLATIIQRDLKNADLAFLSACQTSAGDEKLSDEAVHLAAGMLAVANNFYSYLFGHWEEGSGNSVDGSVSAYALHHAVQQLRQRLDNSENSLLAWAPYVHFGY
ncbi:CHAT domain-containing protein [Coprinopsis sp. MPI-PUGE-AT-0042]|nr:CHAT domain-containing protein [Coprinopsis sp. MPI-PUGE-AT-0042]